MRGSWNFAAPVFEPAAAFAVEALPPLVQAVVAAVVRDAEVVRKPRKVPLCKTDAGRDVPGETNDCTVRSLAVAGQMPYAKAHEMMRTLCGRRSGKGCCPYRAYEAAGAKRLPIDYRRMTLGQFLRRYPVGRFAVTVHAHALAIVDGAAYDLQATGFGARLHSVHQF